MNPDMTKVVIGVGSNCESRCENVRKAIECMSRSFSNFKSSEIYTTKAIGSGTGLYANAVVSGYWSNDYEELYELTKQMEIEFGRKPEDKSERRVTLDVDIVIYGEKTLRPSELQFDYFSIGYSQIN